MHARPLYDFDRIEVNYRAGSAVRKREIRDQALALGLLQEPATEENFIKMLRRSFDASSDAIIQKFRSLAQFSAQAP
jgi:hypothetical protein